MVIDEISRTIKIFLSYTHEDEEFLQGLEKHLKVLQRQGLIDLWHNRNISAGMEWKQEIDKHLNTAHIILLLVSPDFINSDYCYSLEMQQAMERYQRGEARVVPIILRHVYWQDTPFSKLQALPREARPINTWKDLDEAFLDVVEAVRKIVIELFLSPSWSEIKEPEDRFSDGFSLAHILEKLGNQSSPPTSSEKMSRQAISGRQRARIDRLELLRQERLRRDQQYYKKQ